jgi:hypothetical protein
MMQGLHVKLKSRIAKAKAAFIKKKNLFNQQIGWRDAKQ